MKSNTYNDFLKSQSSPFHSVSPPYLGLKSISVYLAFYFLTPKYMRNLIFEIVEIRLREMRPYWIKEYQEQLQDVILNIKERFPQVIECQESKKNQQKLHWRSHQFNTSEDDIVMIGHQQSLQHMQGYQHSELKPSLSPKSSSKIMRGSLQQQQEKLKKIVNLQNTSANVLMHQTSQQKLMMNSHTSTSALVGKISPSSNVNNHNNVSSNQVNQMSKSSSSSVLPPSKNPIMNHPQIQQQQQAAAGVKRSAHIKANNMLHLSNSIDYDCSSSYINPFNYISIKGGPQSTTSLNKGQNQSMNNFSNHQIAKLHNTSATTTNQRKTPQNINNNNNISMNQPLSSQILTSTSQNSNSSKTPNFFVSPKVKKRQSAAATAGISTQSQPASVQSSAHKAFAKRAQLNQLNEVQQRPSTTVMNGNSNHSHVETKSPKNITSSSQLQAQLNQNINMSSNSNINNHNNLNYSVNNTTNNANQTINGNNNSSSNLFVHLPNSNYQQYQILNQKNNTKKSSKESQSHNNTVASSISKKKKKKGEISKNSCLLTSPQSSSYLTTTINNNNNPNTSIKNVANTSKLQNMSQIIQDEEQQSRPINSIKQPTFHEPASNGVLSPTHKAGQEQNNMNNQSKGNIFSNEQQQVRINSDKIGNKAHEDIVVTGNITTVASTVKDNFQQGHASRNYLEGNHEEHFEESKQVSRQSEKLPQYESDEVRRNNKDESKKKKKSRKKSPLQNKESKQESTNQKSKSPSQSRSQKRKQRSSQKRKHMKTSQSPCHSQNKSYSTHMQVSTDYQQLSKSLKSKSKLTNVKSSDNLDSHSHHQNYVSIEEVSKTQQNSLDKTKIPSQLESTVRMKNQSDKLQHTQELIKQNLQKQKLQKMILQQKQKQEMEEKHKKSQYLHEINEQIRYLNSQKSPKRDNQFQQPSSCMNSAITQQNTNSNAFSPIQIDHKIPWGANQQKLNGFYVQSQKTHKNQKSEHDEQSNSSLVQLAQQQKKEQLERQRRERLGLGFLNDKNDSFVEQIVQKKHLLDAQKLQEIHKYMMYKKNVIEQTTMIKNQEKITKVSKIKENKSILESNIRSILKRLRYSNSKIIKNKTMQYPQNKLTTHYFSQFTEGNGALAAAHLTSSDSFHQHHFTSQNAYTVEPIPLDQIESNEEENNYSFLYDEYKKMMKESMQKNLLLQKHNPIESHPSSLASPSVSEQNKIRPFKSVNSKSKQSESNKKDKKLVQQDQGIDDIHHNSSAVQGHDQRGRERTQNVKQKFQDLSERVKKLFESQIGGGISDQEGNSKNQSLSPLHQQQLLAKENQAQIDAEMIQAKQNKVKNLGQQSLQNRNAFKINDDIQATTNGFNTTTTTTQNAQQLFKAAESNVSVPVSSKNESVIIKDYQGEQHMEEEYQESGEEIDQDYFYTAVQYLNNQALIIQKVWRGYRVRKPLQQLREHMIELNSHWLQKQEKIEMNDFYNSNKDNDFGDNQDKVINISTIKSSIVSVNDQTEEQQKHSIPDVLANAIAIVPNRQIPSMVKEEDSSQSRSPANINNQTYQEYHESEFQKQSKQSSYHQEMQSANKNINNIDPRYLKQQENGQNYQQDLIGGLKELVMQKFSQFASQIQNASNFNPEQSKQFLSQLQQISEEMKNELLSTFQNTFENSQQQYDQQGMISAGLNNSNFQMSANPQLQAAGQNYSNSKNDDVKFQSAEEIDNVLIKNNEDQYEDKSIDDGTEGNHDLENEQHDFENQTLDKNQNVENEMLVKHLQNETMKQELNQLYLLLTQEASKDKEKKYYLSSQGISNQNSNRNSYRMRTNPDENDKELKLQSSVDSNGQELVSSSLFDRDSFKLFTEKKLKELQKNEQVEEIIRLREQVIMMRHSTQVEYMNKMLLENAVSPRTYTTNKLELDNWVQKEQDELKETKQDFEKSWKRAIDSISKTKQDYELTKKYKETMNHTESQGSNGPIIEKKFLVDNNQFEDEYDEQTHQKLSTLIPVSIQVQDSVQSKNPLNSISSNNESENFTKFKEELKASALRELSNSYYSSSEVLNSKSPPDSISNRKLSGNYKSKKNSGGAPQDDQENDDNDDLVRVEDKSPDRNGSFDSKKVVSIHEQLEEDKSESNPNVVVINPNNVVHDRNDDNMVILLTSTSKQNLQSSSESIHSQNGIFDSKNPKMKDQLWDSSPVHHNLDTSDYHQRNRERFTNEKMIIKKEDPHNHHNHQLHPIGAHPKKSPRFDTSSFSDSKDTNKDYSPKSDFTESNTFTEDEGLFQKKIQPIFPQNQVQQNGNPLNNNNNAQNPNAAINQQVAILNQADKKEDLNNFSAQIVVNEVFNSINEEIKEKWRMNAQVEERLNEQLNRVECVDKSDRYGIPSNLFVIEQYIISLFQYVKNYYKSEFIENINTPFGFSPQKRLKLIHGYDSFIESTSEQQLEEFSTLPFVLSEELFIEFEQNIIGNGEEEKDQIIKEFQHIHNKAIFDTFNESLNLFRPYFALGGSPYAWSKSEKNIIFCHATMQNLEQILDKAKKKVIEWASFLCGIINEHENLNKRALRTEEDSQSDDKLKSSQESDKSPLQSLLENNNQPENEYFAQSREERLSRMLLVEIFENEYKWQLYEDEKAEVLMELSDLVFEELVEEIVDEIADSKY